MLKPFVTSKCFLHHFKLQSKQVIQASFASAHVQYDYNPNRPVGIPWGGKHAGALPARSLAPMWPFLPARSFNSMWPFHSANPNTLPTPSKPLPKTVCPPPRLLLHPSRPPAQRPAPRSGAAAAGPSRRRAEAARAAASPRRRLPLAMGRRATPAVRPVAAQVVRSTARSTGGCLGRLSGPCLGTQASFVG